MSESAAEQLEAIRATVEQAKSVPMSASCMVNRGETVAALDRAIAAVRAADVAARRESGAEAVADAHALADQILADARADADRLVSTGQVQAKAVAEASDLMQQAESEAAALRKEADIYVDQRMAELEAYMTKTLSQLKTMRARLSERSGLDAPEGHAEP